MASKTTTVYICSNCSKETIRWLGKCPQCGEFQTLEETTVSTGGGNTATAGLKSAGAVSPTRKALTIKELEARPLKRIPTSIFELDRVLGGGFVDGQVVLFAGQPGAGKSTLALEIASKFAERGMSVLYSSGEESEQQIGLRAKRMSVSNELIKITNETSLESLLGHISEEKPSLLIVDSLQTIASSEISGSIGSVSQGKEVAHTLTRLAKKDNIIMILINQIIKSGEFAGSEAVQHIVDCSLIIESDNDTPLKFLRANKNRFGDIMEVGVFQHTETGLEEVTDPAGVFLETEGGELSGTACSFISEGTRQIPVEVQALVSRSTLPNARKQFNGVNYNRGQIVCAILDKFCQTKLFEKDVFISTISGVKINDPQGDLAMAAALLSSSKDKGLNKKTAFVGELGLTGMVRGTFMIENKIKEAERLGFERIVIPQNNKINLKKVFKDIDIVVVKSVKDLLPLYN